MARAVLPKAAKQQRWLVSGRCDEAPSDGGRLPVLSLDDEDDAAAYARTRKGHDEEDGLKFQ